QGAAEETAETSAWMCVPCESYEKARARVEQGLVRCLREIVPNPVRLVAVDPSWLRWNGGIVVSLTQHITKSLTFRRMPLLADALEDAGCADAAILDHCRSGGEHVRGCWVVDCLLAKS